MQNGITVRVPVTITEENAKYYYCIIIAPQAHLLSPSSPCPSIFLLNFLTGCFFILFLSAYFFSSPVPQSSIIHFFFLSFLPFCTLPSVYILGFSIKKIYTYTYFPTQF